MIWNGDRYIVLFPGKGDTRVEIVRMCIVWGFVKKEVSRCY